MREMVTAYQLTDEQHFQAHEHCKARAIAILLVALLARRKLISLSGWTFLFFKIASMDIVHLALLKYVGAQTAGRCLILPTGMATMAEIEQAVETVPRRRQ